MSVATSQEASIWSDSRQTPGRPAGAKDLRTPFEQDYDRLLFSTPVRRLADKTQVFPLERNDSVRNRLTHSHEVANLAKSMGIRVLRIKLDVFGDSERIRQAVPVILSTIGLAHDLGNPPFGHQGEAAIRRWFAERQELFTELGREYPDAKQADFSPVDEAERGDFLKFEGNAQALRLVACLQNMSGKAGLDLTAASLAAMMKYPVPSAAADGRSAATKKFGYMTSETETVSWILRETGLRQGQRHPLTWIMEASDDIAYSVLDIEDAIKKGLVSAEDVLAYLRLKFEKNDELGGLINQLKDDFSKADNNGSLSRVREIKTSYLRTRLVEKLVTGAVDAFLQGGAEILAYQRTKSLLDCNSNASLLCEELKAFASAHAYRSPDVLRLELKGARALETIMSAMWTAIVDRKKFLEPGSGRRTPYSAYVYSLISDSYRWQFEQDASPKRMRYRELQLLVDMVSGMTDGYAVDLVAKISENATV